jgi:transcription elongation factor Elf1
MATVTCSVCGRVFKVFAIEDKSRQRMPVEVKCPFCGSTHFSEVSTRTYVVLKYSEIPTTRLPRHPNSDDGE